VWNITGNASFRAPDGLVGLLLEPTCQFRLPVRFLERAGNESAAVSRCRFSLSKMRCAVVPPPFPPFRHPFTPGAAPYQTSKRHNTFRIKRAISLQPHAAESNWQRFGAAAARSAHAYNFAEGNTSFRAPTAAAPRKSPRLFCCWHSHHPAGRISTIDRRMTRCLIPLVIDRPLRGDLRTRGDGPGCVRFHGSLL
jgi:hypothetical protein